MPPIRFYSDAVRKGLSVFAAFLVFTMLVVGAYTTKLYTTHDTSTTGTGILMSIIVILLLASVAYYLKIQYGIANYEEKLERAFPATPEKLIIEEKRFRGELRELVLAKRAAEKGKTALLKKVGSASFLTGAQADKCDKDLDGFNEDIAAATEKVGERYSIGRGVHFQLPRKESDFATMRAITLQ